MLLFNFTLKSLHYPGARKNSQRKRFKVHKVHAVKGKTQDAFPVRPGEASAASKSEPTVVRHAFEQSVANN